MSKQSFSAIEREAIWLAHRRKCAYTGRLLDPNDFHIDHIIPESLLDNPAELDRVKASLGLRADFDVCGYENLLPCAPERNLQKGPVVFDPTHVHFFLAFALSKKPDVEENIAKIGKRQKSGKALLILQQCLENGLLTPSRVADLLEQFEDSPEQIFSLIEAMRFADSDELTAIAKADIEQLRDRPIRLGGNDHIHGATLTNDADEKVIVRTCREYDDAIARGFYAYSTFDMKMATFFEHQCGLLRALEKASTPSASFIDKPRRGITDANLLPLSLFPDIGKCAGDAPPQGTYQDKIDEGALVVKRLRHNMLTVEESHGMGQQLIEVTRADFDGSGLESILVFEYCYATEGTLGFGGVRILTRRTPDAMYEEVPLA
jgi:hypothetical protein